MDFISGFGIVRAARISGLALSGILLTAGSLPSPATLDVGVSGLRSTKGNVLVCLTANPKHFPDCSKDPRALKQSVPAAVARNIQFEGIQPGTYALALVHDENANNKMDVAVVMPREGFAFSQNPAVVFGPPKFGAAKFVVSGGEARQNVKMKYFL